MNRRGFLKALGFTATLSVQRVADIISPSKTLEGVGATLTTTPPTHMNCRSNAWKNIEWITEQAVKDFEDAIAMERLTNDNKSST